MNDSACYYYILSGEDRLGPLEYEAVKTMTVEGQLTRDHYCWTDGLDEWQPIESVLPELASFLPPQVPSFSQKSEQTLTANPEHDQSIEATASPDNLLSNSADAIHSMYLYIPKRRLIAMSVFTSGLYVVYWCYKNWDYIKKRDNLSIHPFWRSVCSIFFLKTLFTTIKDDHYTNQYIKSAFNDTALYVAWLVCALIRFKFDDIVPSSNFAIVAMLPLLSIIAGAYCLYPVQDYINCANKIAAPQMRYHPLLSRGHIIMLTCFGVIYLYAIILFVNILNDALNRTHY